MNQPIVNLSLAAFPGFEHFHAMSTASKLQEEGALQESLWGPLELRHVQVVPQNRGVFGFEIAHAMRDSFPDSIFRLHANVRVLPERCIYDLSNYQQKLQWFEMAARIQQVLRGECYSAHAGYRENCTLQQMFDNARRAADLFGMPVAIEGLYPDRHNSQLVSTWEEYKALFESGLPYALDLSHLNIVASRSGIWEDQLVQEMLDSDQCLEIHVSDNDGSGDQHQSCRKEAPPWWLELLNSARSTAVVFTEGNLRRRLVESELKLSALA